jgi:hypothetical protein
MKYASTLTTNCGKVKKNHVKTINVNVDIDGLEEDTLRAKMCELSFRYVGILDSVIVK